MCVNGKLSDEFLAYEKFARWQARSVDPFIDYFHVLEDGIRWEKESYGKLSAEELVFHLPSISSSNANYMRNFF